MLTKEKNTEKKLDDINIIKSGEPLRFGGAFLYGYKKDLRNLMEKIIEVSPKEGFETVHKNLDEILAA